MFISKRGAFIFKLTVFLQKLGRWINGSTFALKIVREKAELLKF